MANTQVILRTKIENLGAEADIVTVRSGYARNFLIPQGLAYEATRANRRHTEKLLASRAARESEELEAAQTSASKIESLTLKMKLEVGQEGKAFGSITNVDLAKKLESKGVKVDRHKIILESPIKTTGEHQVAVKLHTQVEATLTVIVKAATAEKSSTETEKS